MERGNEEKDCAGQAVWSSLSELSNLVSQLGFDNSQNGLYKKVVKAVIILILQYVSSLYLYVHGKGKVGIRPRITGPRNAARPVKLN